MLLLYYVIGIGGVSLSFCAFFIWRNRRRSPMLYRRTSIFWIIEAFCFFFSMLTGILPSQAEKGEDLSSYLVCALLALFGIFAITVWLNEIIVWDEKTFTRRNLLRIKRTYAYRDVEGYHTQVYRSRYFTDFVTYIHVNGKKIPVATSDANHEKFLAIVHQKYALTHGGKSLPHIRSAKKKKKEK